MKRGEIVEKSTESDHRHNLVPENKKKFMAKEAVNFAVKTCDKRLKTAVFEVLYKTGWAEITQKKIKPFHNLLLESELICVIMWTNEIIVNNVA